MLLGVLGDFLVLGCFGLSGQWPFFGVFWGIQRCFQAFPGFGVLRCVLGCIAGVLGVCSGV